MERDVTLVDMIFIFWLKWLNLEQCAYVDYKSKVVFSQPHQDFSKPEI